jgi:hypothetical protein
MHVTREAPSIVTRQTCCLVAIALGNKKIGLCWTPRLLGSIAQSTYITGYAAKLLDSMQAVMLANSKLLLLPQEHLQYPSCGLRPCKKLPTWVRHMLPNTR